MICLSLATRRHLVIVIALTSAAPVMAQERAASRSSATSPSARVDTSAPDIIVKGQSLRLIDNAFSTTTLDSAMIKERRVNRVDELLRDVPGVSLQDFGLGGVASATAIRGFGNGGHGGDLGVVVDGIPLNESNSQSDGYVDINVLVPLEIAALTVYRGPISALYGNFNRGGLIAFETRKGGVYAEFDVRGGSFGTADAEAAIGIEPRTGQRLNAAAQFFHSDGYRPRSTLDRYTIAARYAVELSAAVDVAISGRYNRTKADNAGYLIAQQYAVDPYGIDPRLQNDGLTKNFGTLRADLNFTVAPDVRLLTFAYTTRQDFTRYFTRGASTATAIWRQREETFNREVYGAGTSLNGRTTLLGRPLTFVAGIEGFRESTDFIFYDGLNNRRRVAPAIYDRDLTLSSLSAFAETNFSLHRLLDVSLAARVDRFTGSCRRLGPETTPDPCTKLDAVSDISPKIAARSQLLPWLQLRASYAEGFALPGGNVKYAPGAQSLSPNNIRQVEVGARLTPLDRFDFDVVAYRVNSSNEFTAIAPGEFANFGRTRRTGIEASLSWRPVDALDLRVAYGYADSSVRQNFNAALVGKKVTGVPDHSVTASAFWSPIEAVKLNATYRYVGKYPVNPVNTIIAPSYNLIDVGASYKLPTRAPLRLYVNVENLIDKVYAPSVNTIGFATGAPRTFRAGLQFGF